MLKCTYVVIIRPLGVKKLLFSLFSLNFKNHELSWIKKCLPWKKMSNFNWGYFLTFRPVFCEANEETIIPFCSSDRPKSTYKGGECTYFRVPILLSASSPPSSPAHTLSLLLRLASPSSCHASFSCTCVFHLVLASTYALYFSGRLSRRGVIG